MLPRTPLLISLKPKLEIGTIKPGYTCLPVASIIVAPVVDTEAPTPVIFPLSKLTDASVNTVPLPTCTVACVITMGPAWGPTGYTVS